MPTQKISTVIRNMRNKIEREADIMREKQLQKSQRELEEKNEARRREKEMREEQKRQKEEEKRRRQAEKQARREKPTPKGDAQEAGAEPKFKKRKIDPH